MTTRTKTRPRKAHTADTPKAADVATPAPDPIPGLHARIRDCGFGFAMEHDVVAHASDFKTKQTFRIRVHVLITTRHNWMGMPESAHGWSSSLCGEDLVLATMIEDRHQDYQQRHHARTEHDPVAMETLQRFRSILVNFLEQREEIRHLDMLAGGDGSAKIQVAFHDDSVGVDLDVRPHDD